jgi:hypothetical protein
MFKKWHLLFLTIILNFTLTALLAKEIKVYPKHPRLLFRADEVDQIIKRCKQPIFAPIYAAMKEWADDRIKASDGKGDMVTFGFLYQIEKDSKYAREAYKRLMKAHNAKNAFLTPTFEAKYTYDMIYPALNKEERAFMAKKILAMHMSNKYKPNVMGMHQICNEGSSTLAVWGDEGMDMKILKKRLKKEADAFHNKYFKRANVIAERWGGWHRSFECECWTRYVARFSEMWLNATGEDTFDNNLVRGHGTWYLYHMLPGFMQGQRFRLVPDAYTQFNAVGFVNNRATTLIVAKRLNEGLCQWWWKQPLTRNQVWGYSAFRKFLATQSLEGLNKKLRDRLAYSGTLWQVILYYDPAVKELSPETFPEDAFHRGMGLVSTRANWNDDSAFGFFHSGRMASGKPDDLDNNNFFIYRNGYLTADGWPPGKTAHYGYEWDNYRRRTVAHNLITIYDKDEPLKNFWSQYARPKSKSRAGKADSNDGGQMGQVMFELDPKLHPWKEEARVNIYKPNAYIKAFRSTPAYSYVLGDATESYSPKKMEAFTREFVFLKPDIFVVFDRVVSTKAEFPKAWNIHPMQKPELKGNSFRWQAYRPRTNLSGKEAHPLGWLVGTTLLPEQHKTDLFGGKGQECWVDGKNYHTIREGSRGKNDVNDWKHSWRIEVKPAKAAKEDIFLHVLQTFPDKPVKVAKSKLIKGKDFVGAVISLGKRKWKITFPKNGKGGGKLELYKNEKLVLDDKLPTTIEDTYKYWSKDPRYRLWTTDPRYRIVIPEKDRIISNKNQ